MSSLIAYAIPVMLGFLLLELAISLWRKNSWYHRSDSLACLAMGIGNVIIAAAFKTVSLGCLFWLYENYRLTTLPSDLWWAWLLLFLGEDFCYYWFHRLHHEVRFMWAAHVNHHSSEYFNFAVALRQSWTTPMTGFLFWAPLVLIGFHPLMVLTQKAISLIYQFFIHTQAVQRLGPLEWVFNTPSHHRVHHGSNPQYIDRNYGGILIIWDRLFGSFEPEKAPVQFGLTRNLGSFNLITIAFHEWKAMFAEFRSAKDWATRVRSVLGRPGVKVAAN